MLNRIFNRIVAFMLQCSHRRFTWVFGDPAKNSTYVICLDCGQHFHYDWKAMRVTGKRTHTEIGPNVLLIHPRPRGLSTRPDLRNPVGISGSRRALCPADDRMRSVR